ncbi:MAG TPA: MFS transporter, partial [Chloroflexaceae bacterium]|nr:MFS transporter [Chloroflexaceae bacterium]
SSRVIALNGGPVTPITAAPPEALAGGFDLAMRIAAGLAVLAILPSLGGGRAVAEGRAAAARAD